MFSEEFLNEIWMTALEKPRGVRIPAIRNKEGKPSPYGKGVAIKLQVALNNFRRDFIKMYSPETDGEGNQQFKDDISKFLGMMIIKRCVDKKVDHWVVSVVPKFVKEDAVIEEI